MNIEWQAPNPETTAIYRGAVEYHKHCANELDAKAQAAKAEREAKA
jgi:hypothetical protein